MNDDFETIAQSWIKLQYAQEDSSEYGVHFWAYTNLDRMIDEQPEQAVRLINLIRAIDGSDVVLANLAAGPMEDLLVRHGEKIITQIIEIAQKDMQFRKLLGAVWQNEISDAVWREIQSVAQPSW